MKQNFSVKRWMEDLVIEEVSMHLVPFWVQMKAIPSYLCSEENINRLASKCGELLKLEDTARAKGFLRVRIMVDTTKPLAIGCWVTRANDKESWVEFQYERLQDFCYKCGRIGHASNECSSLADREDAVSYKEWTRTKMIRDFLEVHRMIISNQRMRR
ncbi:hypothetical protein ACFX2J_043827 [Malus domestica]